MYEQKQSSAHVFVMYSLHLAQLRTLDKKRIKKEKIKKDELVKKKEIWYKS